MVEDGKLRFHNVKTIYTSPEIAILRTGPDSTLTAGEKVVLSAVPGAFEGMSVQVKSNQDSSTLGELGPDGADSQVNETALTPEPVIETLGEEQSELPQASEQEQI